MARNQTSVSAKRDGCKSRNGHARIQKKMSEGFQLWKRFLIFFFIFILVDEGRREDSNTLKAGHYRPTAKRS